MVIPASNDAMDLERTMRRVGALLGSQAPLTESPRDAALSDHRKGPMTASQRLSFHAEWAALEIRLFETATDALVPVS